MRHCLQIGVVSHIPQLAWWKHIEPGKAAGLKEELAVSGVQHNELVQAVTDNKCGAVP